MDSNLAIYRKWFNSYTGHPEIKMHVKNIITVLKEDIASGAVTAMEAKGIRGIFRNFCKKNGLKMEEFK